MMVKSNRPLNNGLTLIEALVAMTVLTVGILGFMGSFGYISKALRVSKARTIANNLVSEKIESMKDTSYHRLLVTTSPVTASEDPSVIYDNGYYPSEEMRIGQISFERRVLVQKVTESSGTLKINDPFDDDTGAKQITVYVLWQRQGEWFVLSTTNLIENPYRQTIDAKFSGTVVSGFTNLEGAQVNTLENPLYKDIVASNGSYSIDVPAGDYTLRATLDGYFPQSQSGSVSASGTTTISFDLVAMSSGSVSGTAFVNSHLVLSELCASVNGTADLEYVELYNPTSEPFIIDLGGSNPTYLLQFLQTAPAVTTDLNTVGQTIYVSSFVPAFSYYLLASSPTIVNGLYARSADAYYSDAGLINNIPADRIPDLTSGGVALTSRGTYEANGTLVDAVGWGQVGPPYGPTGAREGNGLNSSPTDGPPAGSLIERVAYSSSTEADMDTEPAAGIHSDKGNAYDSNENDNDWVFHAHADNAIPQNTGFIEEPQSGTPAEGAVVFVDDGLSSSVKATSGGSFSVTSVATGTWTVLISSNGYSQSLDNITVTDHSDTPVEDVIITTKATFGIVAGRVVDDSLTALPSIKVDAAGVFDTTDSGGSFRLQVGLGTYTIRANENNTNPNYTVGTATGISVNVGEIVTVDDIALSPGGTLMGFVSTNGVDPLPDIPIVATAAPSGAEITAVLSDSLGKFTISNIEAGDYTVSPQLLQGELAIPSSLSGTVTSGGTVFVGTFSVSSAFGSVAGTVTDGGQAIETGILVVAVSTDAPITGNDPPLINETLRNGSTIYYVGSSDSEGNYSVSIPGGIDYDIYAWYTTITNGVATTVKKSSSTSVLAGTATPLNFSWP